MRRWSLSLPLSCASVALMLQAASAYQVKVEAQAQPAVQVQAKPVQIQVQVQPGVQIGQADIVVARPGFGGPSMGASRLTQSDAVLVGRVVAIEPMDVDASPIAGQPNAKYRVAVVQVSEAIHGLKKDTQMVRVGFIAQNIPGGINGGIQIQPLPAIQPGQPVPFGRRPFIQNVQLDVGQDGIFMLNKHHKENFYLASSYNSFINRQNNPNFDADVKTAKQLAKVMGDPIASLKADTREDRYVAAAVLIAKYRMPNNPTGQAVKLMPIDSAESKLILKALAEGDWQIGRFNATIPNPFELFNQMGVTQKDGYNPVNARNQQDISTAMQKWLAENNAKYVIQKLVVDPNAKIGVIQPGFDPQPIPLPNPKFRPVPPIKGKVQPLPIKIQPLPAPAPQPAPAPGGIEAPPPGAVPVPIRRD